MLSLNPTKRTKRGKGREGKGKGGGSWRLLLHPSAARSSIPPAGPKMFLLLAVVSFVPLVHGVVRGLHPLLLEELLELGQPHVGVLVLQAGQVELLEGREGGFHAALGVPVQLVGDTAGWKEKETHHQQGHAAPAAPKIQPRFAELCSPARAAQGAEKKAGDKAGSPLPAPNAPRDVGARLRPRCRDRKVLRRWGKGSWGGNSCGNFSSRTRRRHGERQHGTATHLRTAMASSIVLASTVPSSSTLRLMFSSKGTSR